MKKQILIFAMFTLAIMFAGMRTYGQVDIPNLNREFINCPKPDALNCEAGSPLKPSPGVIYQYEITVSPTITETGSGSIHWFATTDVNILVAENTITTDIQQPGGTYILTAGTQTITDPVISNANYDDSDNKGTILEIAWNYFDPTITVLLVAFVKDDEGCTDNIEVFKIEPSFNFIVDIFALSDDGEWLPADDPEFDCVSPIQKATYTDDGGGLIEMDYGDNYIFYLVTAANWVHSWMPNITAPTSSGGSTVGDVQWKYASDAHDGNINWNNATDPVLATGYGASVTSIGDEGACIILRVNVLHSNLNEFITAETYTMGIKGNMYDASRTSDYYDNEDLRDLNNDPDNPGQCINSIPNTADYIISPRPSITAVPPSDPFIDKEGRP